MTASPTRVLIVDDHAVVRQGLRLLLESYSDLVVVGEAEDGEAALRRAATLQPDVILLDVMMPGRNGWQVAQELLADEKTSSIPIVFLTARAEVKDRARGIDLGGVEYVTKPFNPIDLAPLVHDLLRRVEGGEREELRREKFAELRELIERE